MLSVLSFLAFLSSSLAFHPFTVPNYALIGHVYRSLQNHDWLNCIQSCHDDPNCFSYNFVRGSTHGLGVCQMIDCGLEDLCNTDGLVFSSGAIFQQIAPTGGTGMCESSSESHDPKADFSLLFPPPRSVTNYVHGDRSILTLSKLSVCFWVKASRNRITVFSYLGIRGTKELVLQIHDRNYIQISVGGEARSVHAQVNDGKWRHICAAWTNADGQWALFRDGVVVDSGTGFKDGYVILEGGTLILGQEQRSDKSFDSTLSFIGELANFNLWKHYVRAIEVSRLSKSCLNKRGDVFHWSSFRRRIEGKVKMFRPSSCVSS